MRTPVEFAEVHVPQARNVPLDELQAGLAPAAAKTSRFICFAAAASAPRKQRKNWRSEGFAQPIVVEGGTLAWIEANLPVTRSAVKVISLERQVRIAAGSLVLTGVLLGWFVHRGFFGLSAFVGAGLVFAGITDFCGMGLLLAKLPWNKRG